MEKKFRGRTTELKILEQKFRKTGFVMTVIYGRRRVGKTRFYGCGQTAETMTWTVQGSINFGPVCRKAGEQMIAPAPHLVYNLY